MRVDGKKKSAKKKLRIQNLWIRFDGASVLQTPRDLLSVMDFFPIEGSHLGYQKWSRSKAMRSSFYICYHIHVNDFIRKGRFGDFIALKDRPKLFQP